MRLALVTETFPPEINGVAKTLGRWVETFRQRGHEVEIIRPCQPQERLAEDGILALAVPFYPQVRLGLALPRQLMPRLRRHGTELVHIATEGPLGLAALWAAERLRLPVASSFHTNFDQYMTHYGLKGWEWYGRSYLRWFHNHTQVTLVPSRDTQSRLREAGFERVELWSRGVDAKLFHPRNRDVELRASLGLGANDVLLLYVGRLAWEKNLEALLAAFATVRGQPCGRQVRLALVGDGPLLESLRGRQLPDVVLPGALHGRTLARWFASADLFTFPSWTETFGNAILEAQASGLPVLAFSYAATRERIKTGVDGVLLDAEGEFAAAIADLIAAPERRRELSAAARATAERQGWEPIFDELEQRYRTLIASSRPQRTTGRATKAARMALA